MKGRGDFTSIFLIELLAGRKTSPKKHLFQEMVYVISSHGNTTIVFDNASSILSNWDPKAY